MLVLERKEQEAVLLELPSGETIRVILVRVSGSRKARIGFETPDDVHILREELAHGR